MASQRSSPIEKLAEALFIAGDACLEIASHLVPSPYPKTTPQRACRKSPRGQIIPHYVFEYHRERSDVGEKLDMRMAELQKEEWRQNRRLHSLQLGDWEALKVLEQLDRLRQEMTQIEAVFQSEDQE